MKAKQSHFNFDLPKDLISKYPAKERDESRLMVIDRGTGKIEHKVFKDLLDYFEEDDCFIMNNTKVFPARLYGCKEKTGEIGRASCRERVKIEGVAENVE